MRTTTQYIIRFLSLDSETRCIFIRITIIISIAKRGLETTAAAAELRFSESFFFFRDLRFVAKSSTNYCYSWNLRRSRGLSMTLDPVNCSRRQLEVDKKQFSARTAHSRDSMPPIKEHSGARQRWQINSIRLYYHLIVFVAYLVAHTRNNSLQ